MRRKIFFLSVLSFIYFISLLTPLPIQSHSGRTDANGGHYNRKTGEYHYHNKPSQNTTTSDLKEKESYKNKDKKELSFHGNKNSKKFHKSACQYYNCKNCIVVFKTRKEAIESGYVPCKICKP